jgi:hypothetical protein
MKTKLLLCVDRLRGTTVEVVEALVKWRRAHSADGEAAVVGVSGSRVFTWRGENYLFKMAKDLDSLDPAFTRHGLGIRAAENPLLLPGAAIRCDLPPALVGRCKHAVAVLLAEHTAVLPAYVPLKVSHENLDDAIDALAQQAAAQALATKLRLRQERPPPLPRVRATWVTTAAAPATASATALAATWTGERTGPMAGRRGVVSDDVEYAGEQIEGWHAAKAVVIAVAEEPTDRADAEASEKPGEANLEAAALNIQRVARGSQQRRRTELARLVVVHHNACYEAYAHGLDEAAGFFQSLIAAVHERREDDATPSDGDEPAHVREPEAATKLQAACRGRVARREVARVREVVNAAAVKLQARQRLCAAKKTARTRRAERDSAWAEEKVEESSAALRIQCAQRGRAARRRISKLVHKRHATSATVIDATSAAQQASASASEAAAVFSELARQLGTPHWSPQLAPPPLKLPLRTKRRGLLVESGVYSP